MRSLKKGVDGRGDLAFKRSSCISELHTPLHKPFKFEVNSFSNNAIHEQKASKSQRERIEKHNLLCFNSRYPLYQVVHADVVARSFRSDLVRVGRVTNTDRCDISSGVFTRSRGELFGGMLKSKFIYSTALSLQEKSNMYRTEKKHQCQWSRGTTSIWFSVTVGGYIAFRGLCLAHEKWSIDPSKWPCSCSDNKPTWH